MHNGVMIGEGCYYGPWMTEIIRGLHGHHEPQEELVFHRVIERLARDKERPRMVELGSFWAYYSLWFMQAFPEGTVVALEPDPDYLEVGRRNFAINGRTGLFIHGAVGPDPGTTLGFTTESTGQVVQVLQYDLRSLLEEVTLDRVDLLMADIQGAETILLERAVPMLSEGRVRFLIVSTHHHSISGDPLTHHRALGLLTACGGHVITEHTVGESFSGDGLIAVSFDPSDGDFIVEVSRARQRDSLFGELEHDLARAQAEAARAQNEAARAIAEEAQRHSQIRTLDDELRRTRGELDAIKRSRSWRWTAPSRAIGATVRSLRPPS
jgi:FkbM family methyltransferase